MPGVGTCVTAPTTASCPLPARGTTIVAMLDTRCLRRVTALAMAAAVMLDGRPAAADSPLTIARGWYVSPGLPFALSARKGGGGFVTGAELSLAGYEVIGRPGHGWWTGLYVDGVEDSGTDSKRLSVGPEIGNTIFGIDGGYLLERTDGRTLQGVCVRPLLTIGWVALFARVGWLPDANNATFGEFGLLLKAPMNIACERGTPGCR